MPPSPAKTAGVCAERLGYWDAQHTDMAYILLWGTCHPSMVHITPLIRMFGPSLDGSAFSPWATGEPFVHCPSLSGAT